MHTFTVKEHEAGWPLLQFLQEQIPTAGRGYLRQLIKKGRVSIAGQVCTENTLLIPAQQIQLRDSARLRELCAEASIPAAALNILYESEQMLVVDKPAGLAVHTGSGHESDNLNARVQVYLQGKPYQVAPIHRLDVGTSGPVLFGKGKKSCAALGMLFMRHEAEKVYVALVQGNMQGGGVLAHELLAKGKLKPCVTSFVTRKRCEEASLVELTLVTGRQHQIRRQLAETGHPIFGDSRYGGEALPGLQYPFLHCSSIAFTDPFNGAPLKIESPLPPALQEVADIYF
ncbi:MAG: RluA family pseudouridine synthase [Desulfuromonadaceae bacterium]|nr:RluA family pseudouridine synthase [Desulfuromonas sp.]MDY0184528.1 RluA family pseudouridine synthase [Desulfuromonadaceae bacterium]